MQAKDLTDFQVGLQLFAGYEEADAAIFEEFRSPDAKGEPGFLTDFLGSRIRTTSVWKEARELDGQLLGIPLPADFHSEAVEWIGLLKAVQGATDEYVAMELGAGFGPWSVAGAVAAKRRGIENIRLCSVEADPQHFLLLRQHFIDNGLDPGEHVLIEAVVGIHSGEAQWPVIDESSSTEEWGLRPLELDRDYNGRHFANTRRVEVIPVLALVTKEPCWDLIHIDVQGAEVEICRSCVEELNARVRRIVVGTHSRKIDGDLLELMYGAGWVLEHEKPTRFAFAVNRPTLESMTTVDGTQVWRNPRLTPIERGDRLTVFAQEITSPNDFIFMRRGDTRTVDITVRNTGSQPWFGGIGPTSVNAGYRWRAGNGDMLPIEGLRATLGNRAVRPGESASLQLEITAPDDPDSYTLWVSMVQEDVAWFFDKQATPLALQVTVD